MQDKYMRVFCYDCVRRPGKTQPPQRSPSARMIELYMAAAVSESTTRPRLIDGVLMKCLGQRTVGRGESLMRIASNLTCIHTYASVCVCACACHCIIIYYNAVDPFTLHHISRGLHPVSGGAVVCARVVAQKKKHTHKSYTIIIDMLSAYKPYGMCVYV